MKPLSILAVTLLGLLGQPAPEATPAPNLPASEQLRVMAVHALTLGRSLQEFDPTLAQLEAYLSALPYDTFREIGYHQVKAVYGEETAVVIDDRYTVYCSPTGQTEEGEVEFDAHVDMRESGRTLEAIRVSGRASRGQGVVFRGLTMPAGELVVVLSVVDPNEKGTGDGQGEQGRGEAGDGGTQSGDSGEGRGDGGEDVSEAAQDTGLDAPEEEFRDVDETPSELLGNGNRPLPPELANIEGILQALEDQDMAEQKRARSRRYDVVIQGDWW